MAETVVSHPPSRSTPAEKQDRKSDALAAQLDGLLEQYLELLDQYTRLRDDLAKTFSSGFFSLAQAQRATTLGAGRRYGQDCYDQRMKAQRRVVLHRHEDSPDFVCHIEKRLEPGVRQSSTEDGEAPHETQAETGQIDQETGNKPEKETSKVDEFLAKNEPGDTEKPPTTPRPDPAARDPITWFGLLTPPALRQTRGHFVKAVEHQIPDLLNVGSEMKRLEGEIWSVRDELGISCEYEIEEVGQGATGETGGQEEGKQLEPKPAKSSKSSRRSLASRPTHSKSPLLKLGD